MVPRQSVISSPSRFFKAIAAANPKMPLVTGDLQYHAIGCYSVHRPVKTALRRAEHLLYQAEVVRSELGRKAALLPDLQRGWEQVCFHHFHDTLGGTCIPSAYAQVLNQLGEAASLADENLQVGLRLLIADLPGDPLQRIVCYNPSLRDFSGYVEIEPWIDSQPWEGTQIVDEAGRTVPHQGIHTEATTIGLTRILIYLKIPPKGKRLFRLRRDLKPKLIPPNAVIIRKQIKKRLGVRVLAGAKAQLSFLAGKIVLRPEWELLEDPSDTWSHGIDRYQGRIVARPKWNAPQYLDRGPLMTSFLQTGTISQSQIQTEYRVYAGQPWVELRLRVHWMEVHKILKLVLRRSDFGPRRIDGILGGQLGRPNLGQESPIQNWTLFTLGKEVRLGIVCPDVYALDATDKRLALTLLRSPLLAHHEPDPGTDPRGTPSDQGVHDFRFKFWAGKGLSPRVLEKEAFQIQEPPLFADLTKGMPCRWIDYFKSTPKR